MIPNAQPGGTPHIARIDLLRGLAITAVFIFHFSYFAFGKLPSPPWQGNWRLFGGDVLYTWLYPISLGWIGVPLFFVLSGFCIHWSFLQAKRFTTANFFERRFFRIYLPYLACLVALLVTSKELHWDKEGVWQAVSHLLLIHNYSEKTMFAINAPFWSLALEAQFYLLYPLLLLVYRRWNMRGCVLFTLVLSLVSRAVLACFFPFPDHPHGPVWSCLPITWFDWVLGAWLAERHHAGRRIFPAKWLLSLGLLLLFVGSTLYKPATIFSFAFGSLFSAAILEMALNSKAPLILPEKVLAGVGLISYSLYLWHGRFMVGLINAVSKLLHLPPDPRWQMLVCLPIVFVLSSGIAFLSYIVLERGSLLLGKRWRRFNHERAQAAMVLAEEPAAP